MVKKKSWLCLNHLSDLWLSVECRLIGISYVFTSIRLFWILNTMSGLTTEGIYRVCGQQSVVTRLLSSLTTGELCSNMITWDRCVIVLFNFYLVVSRSTDGNKRENKQMKDAFQCCAFPVFSGLGMTTCKVGLSWRSAVTLASAFPNPEMAMTYTCNIFSVEM